MMTKANVSKKQNHRENHTSFKETAKSVGAAFIGVQSDKNRERDFSQGRLSHYIIAGVIGVALFIGVLIGLVAFILP